MKKLFGKSATNKVAAVLAAAAPLLAAGETAKAGDAQFNLTVDAGSEIGNSQTFTHFSENSLYSRVTVGPCSPRAGFEAVMPGSGLQFFVSAKGSFCQTNVAPDTRANDRLINGMIPSSLRNTTVGTLVTSYIAAESGLSSQTVKKLLSPNGISMADLTGAEKNRIAGALSRVAGTIGADVTTEQALGYINAIPADKSVNLATLSDLARRAAGALETYQGPINEAINTYGGATVTVPGYGDVRLPTVPGGTVDRLIDGANDTARLIERFNGAFEQFEQVNTGKLLNGLVNDAFSFGTPGKGMVVQAELLGGARMPIFDMGRMQVLGEAYGGINVQHWSGTAGPKGVCIEPVIGASLKAQANISPALTLGARAGIETNLPCLFTESHAANYNLDSLYNVNFGIYMSYAIGAPNTMYELNDAKASNNSAIEVATVLSTGLRTDFSFAGTTGFSRERLTQDVQGGIALTRRSDFDDSRFFLRGGVELTGGAVGGTSFADQDATRAMAERRIPKGDRLMQMFEREAGVPKGTLDALSPEIRRQVDEYRQDLVDGMVRDNARKPLSFNGHSGTFMATVAAGYDFGAVETYVKGGLGLTASFGSYSNGTQRASVAPVGFVAAGADVSLGSFLPGASFYAEGRMNVVGPAMSATMDGQYAVSKDLTFTPSAVLGVRYTW